MVQGEWGYFSEHGTSGRWLKLLTPKPLSGILIAMLEITIEINGKPFKGDLVDAFQAAAIEGIRKEMHARLEKGLTSGELSQLKVKLVGTDLSNLSLNLNGPEEIIEKAKKAVKEE